MRFSQTVAALALAGSAAAQLTGNQTICTKYTAALFNASTPANQEKLLVALVNTAVLGNTTANKANVAVNGILNPGEYMGYKVNLAGFFNGGLQSTNRNDQPTSVNFLDGGGAAPLIAGMASNVTSSNQYKLLTHLYSYFGVLLGCDGVGQDGFPAYAGSNSQYSVHKYMALDQYQNGYFITQVGLAAASYGVTTEDITTVGNALVKVFNYKCSPPTEVVPGTGKSLQSICIADSCPVDPKGNCSETGYMNVTSLPAIYNMTLAGNSTNVTDSSGSNVNSAVPSATSTMRPSSATASASSSSSSAAATAIAIKIGESGLGLALGAAAFAFAL